MKKITLLLLATIYSFMLVAQDKPKGKLSFFSQDGVKFWVILDGVKQNKDPQYAVNDIEVDFEYGKARIVFQDPKIKPIDQNVQVIDVDGNICSSKYMIKKKKKGYDITGLPVMTVIWENPNPPMHNDFNNNTNNQTNNNQNNNQVNNNTNNQTNNNQNTNNQGNNQNTNFNDEFNLNIKVNDNGMTTTTTTNNHANGIIVNNNTNPNPNNNQNNTNNNNSNPMNNNTTVVTNNPVPGYTGRKGCNNVTTDLNFKQMINTLKAKTFETDKEAIAKQLFRTNCYTVAQVKEILTLFTFESNRLDLAKFAYSCTFDYDNYYQLNELFTFSSSIDELNDYINNFKR